MSWLFLESESGQEIIREIECGNDPAMQLRLFDPQNQYSEATFKDFLFKISCNLYSEDKSPSESAWYHDFVSQEWTRFQDNRSGDPLNIQAVAFLEMLLKQFEGSNPSTYRNGTQALNFMRTKWGILPSYSDSIKNYQKSLQTEYNRFKRIAGKSKIKRFQVSKRTVGTILVTGLILSTLILIGKKVLK